MPDTVVKEAWAILADQTLDTCWSYALLTIGFKGGLEDVKALEAYLYDPSRSSLELKQLGAFSMAPYALGYLAGRNNGQTTQREAVRALIECSKPSRWLAGDLQWVKSEGRARHFANACVAALRYTLSEVALDWMKAIANDPMQPSRLVATAKGGIQIFESIRTIGFDTYIKGNQQ